MARQVIKDRSVRYVRDEYDLQKWAKKHEARLQTYFEGIDEMGLLLKKMKGTDPTDEQLMTALSLALEEDDTLTNHISGFEGSSALTDNEMWAKVTLAAAGTVLQAYVTAVDKGNWPPAGS